MSPESAEFGYSAREFARRRGILDEITKAAGLDALLLYGANRTGGAVTWLTGWPVTREAHVVVRPGEPAVLLVNFFNHVPNAARLAVECEVGWAGADPIATVSAVLAAHRVSSLGVMGPLPFQQRDRLSGGVRIVSTDAALQAARMIKSAEEVESLRRGAALTDLAATAMVEPRVSGYSEHELIARFEVAYIARGGSHYIHYLTATNMARPERSVPAQWSTGRVVCSGDLLTFELSAAVVPDYPGQLLRTFTVDALPTGLVSELHEVAAAALERVSGALAPGVLPADLVDAAGVIEDAGFTTLDDLVHGFGGGYLPPVIGSRSRAILPVPSEPLRAGMTVVVQPNVTDRAGTIGVQTGELFLITETGSESLHSFPRGLGRLA